MADHALRTGAALARAGFRRFSTYRQATIAGLTTNMVFGLLRYYVLLATTVGAAGAVAGYDLAQLSSYVWFGQGLLTVVMLWGWTELSDRVRTGDVVADLLRPVNPLWTYLATDLGRAGYNFLVRMLVPIAFGAIFFPFYFPHAPATYPITLVSTALAVVVCFGCRYLVNLTSFWLLDVRGAMTVWLACSGVLSGMYFPIAFMPGWIAAVLQYATPFPSMIQTPIDIYVERGGLGGQLLRLLVQAAWAVAILALAHLVQTRATRKLVIQGG
ncbi:ABC transporter permease [Actinorhabdospora filicis]|uniref:ABC transporter permease n=1 Tax=Actinorhabdospora filicis TaxID=1785913 RepID=A0A9W6SN78_9ACTN|nr:ABC-2 family transporter protein [Actinorhabdospora filicis]GLZ80009.1 ABC transporter permease [Actinorhabdospora filicis]